MWTNFKKLTIPWMGCLLVLTFSMNEGNALKKRVCVIGAGSAGLASLKQLAEHLDEFEPIVFEKTAAVGGLWIYTDNAGLDQFGLPVHSSMYSNLRANSPSYIMSYPNYKNYTDGDRTAARSEVISQYLQNFTRDFDLYKYIRFNTLVEKITPLSSTNGKQSQWLVLTRTANINQSYETICDAVIVCNGHNSKPYIPKILGIESFPGRILHSCTYRKAEEFKNRTVVLLGAASSGTDIAIQLSDYAKTVYLSHRGAKLQGKQPSNVIQVAGVVSANGSELTLQDGSNVTADTFIYCTGYLVEIPFLDNSSGVQLTNNSKDVVPLYKYVVNVEHPSMGFVGLMLTGFLSLPKFYLQAQYYVAVLQGNIQLPNRTEMLEDVDRLHSLPQNMSVFEWNLYDEYVDSGHVKPLPNYLEPALKFWQQNLSKEQFYSKDYNLRIYDDGRFEIYKSNGTDDISNDVNDLQ